MTQMRTSGKSSQREQVHREIVINTTPVEKVAVFV